MKFQKSNKEALHERLNFLNRLKDSKDFTVTAAVNPVMADAYVASQKAAEKLEDIYKDFDKEVEDINKDKIASGEVKLVDKLDLKEDYFNDFIAARPYSVKFLELVDEGILDAKELLTDLVQWLSEDEVKDFCVKYAIFDEDELDECKLTESKQLKEDRPQEPLYDDLYDEIWLQLSSTDPMTDKQIYNKGIYSAEHDSDKQQLAYYNDVPEGYQGLAVYAKDEKGLDYAKKIADKYSEWITTKPVPSRNLGNVGVGNTVGIVFMIPEYAEALNLDDERIRKMKADTIARRRANREAKRAAKENK